MPCETFGCRNEAGAGERFCASCLARGDEPQPALFPVEQAQRDILLHRRYSEPSFVHPRRSSTPPPPSSRKRKGEDLRPSNKRTKSALREPAVDRCDLPILFVAFEGNFNTRIVGGYQKKGNQSASIVEGSGGSPVVKRRKESLSGDMAETVGDPRFWSGRKGEMETVPLLASSKKGFFKKLDEEGLGDEGFYTAVVEDRLKSLCFGPFSGADEGLPEVIVLSEQLLDWPAHFTVLTHKYTRCGGISPKSNLQRMAAFVLFGKAQDYTFKSVTRADKFKSSFTETWLLVSKGSFTVACVHLSSQYTSSGASHSSAIFQKLFDFARKNGVHALLGDFNLNTYGVHGGAFPVSSDFAVGKSGLSLTSKFASSSGSGDKAYMGGLICDPRVSLLPTLSTFGMGAVSPWFSSAPASSVPKDFAETVFSDHHSLYCRYVLYDKSALLSRRFRTKGGGDCFFDALKLKLPQGHPWKTKSVAQLRIDVVQAIRGAVRGDPHFRAGRNVLNQVQGEDYALPVWCKTVDDFLAEIAEPGRWVDDSILPYIALNMGLQFVIQYAHGYAVFDKLGVRSDHPGQAPLVLEGIHMYCAGNHFS